MEPTELPPLWALEMAVKAAGFSVWANCNGLTSGCRASIIAHARTLAKYETPPVDPAELKRWQDAREAAACEMQGMAVPRDIRNGLLDGMATVRSAYIALCHRDGVEPQDKAPGGVA